MSNWNNVHFEGTVGKDAELRTTAKGSTMSTFDIAVYQGKEKPSMWLQVKAFSETTNITKGMKVAIDGNLYCDEWQAKDGSKRKTFGVWASNLSVIEREPIQDIPF